MESRELPRTQSPFRSVRSRDTTHPAKGNPVHEAISPETPEAGSRTLVQQPGQPTRTGHQRAERQRKESNTARRKRATPNTQRPSPVIGVRIDNGGETSTTGTRRDRAQLAHLVRSPRHKYATTNLGMGNDSSKACERRQYVFRCGNRARGIYAVLYAYDPALETNCSRAQATPAPRGNRQIVLTMSDVAKSTLSARFTLARAAFE